MTEDDEFAEFVSARWLRLVRAGVALGCSLHEAEDLAQATLLKCFVSWSKVTGASHRDAYVSRILLNAHRDSHRARWRREVPVSSAPETPQPDETERFAAADALRRAVQQLSQGQREVIALRFYVHLPDEQIAEALGIALGTVKSRMSRALDQLATSNHLTELRDGGTT